MIKIRATKNSDHYVELYPGEVNVDWLFNKLKYSVPEILLKRTGNEESEHPSHIEVQLKNGETFEEFIEILKHELIFTPDAEQTIHGYTLYLTKPFLN